MDTDPESILCPVRGALNRLGAQLNGLKEGRLFPLGADQCLDVAMRGAPPPGCLPLPITS